jgi:hypothetical protein
MALVVRARWFLWSKDVGPEVVDFPFFFDFVDGRRKILVEESTRHPPGRRATTTCASLRAACLFTDSQSVVGDGAFSDLAMVEARQSSGVRVSGAGVWRRPLMTVVA